MSISFKKEHHINQLLTTAATGAGIIGDVDALLTPIQMTPQQRHEPKAERNLWREEEMLQMLNLMLRANAIEMLNDKSVKSEKVFRNIEKLMFECGYRKKSYMQIWTKWKFLKSTYTTSRRAGVIPRMIPPSIYNILHTILNNVPNSSTDSAKSNAEATGGGSSLDGDNSDSSRLIISHVESGCPKNGVSKSNVRNNNSGSSHSSNEETEEANGLDVAHPIFGFRLGLVKQEPVDTGYENSQLNGGDSEQDPLDHATSPDSEIKQETEEGVTYHSFSRKHQDEEDDCVDRELVIRRDSSQASRPVITGDTLNKRDKQMPPLRIATFAKASQISLEDEYNFHDCSPPPLSTHNINGSPEYPQQPIHQHFTRQSQNQNGLNIGKVRMQRMWVQKQIANERRVIPTTTAGAPIRLPRDITIHQTRPTMMGAAQRAKQVIARHPNYDVRRDEKVLPDPETDETALQQQKSQCFATSFVHTRGHTPSQRASPHPEGSTPDIFHQRKRRLQLPYSDTRPMKVAKGFAPNEKLDSLQDNSEFRQHKNREDYAAAPAITPVSFKLSQQTIKLQQKYLKQQQHQQQQRNLQKKRDENYLEAALRDLSKSLRTTQRQIINDFFERQMQLARDEREFQAQQDKLLIQAFGEQTQLLLESIKKTETKRIEDYPILSKSHKKKEYIASEDANKRPLNDNSTYDFEGNQDSMETKESDNEEKGKTGEVRRGSSGISHNANNNLDQEQEYSNGAREKTEDQDSQTSDRNEEKSEKHFETD